MHMVTRGDRRTLSLVMALTATYLVVEIIGGLLTNSLALLSDAGHMVSDVGGLIISLVAVTLACWPSSPERPFGLRRVEILAALINGIILIGIDVFILYESYQRFLSPQPVQSIGMLAVASGGLIINLVSAQILSRASKRSLNIRGAFLHVVIDALGSVGAMVAGIVMFFTDFYLVDALVGFLIGIILIPSVWRLLKESSNILLESCPVDVGVPLVKTELRKVQGVKDVHDLHIWSISSGIYSLSVHLVIESLNHGTEVLHVAKRLLDEKFDIHHATIQIEELCEDEFRH
jgi:cobalt-zinc-cadmium efflux system protein